MGSWIVCIIIANKDFRIPAFESMYLVLLQMLYFDNLLLINASVRIRSMFICQAIMTTLLHLWLNTWPGMFRSLALTYLFAVFLSCFRCVFLSLRNDIPVFDICIFRKHPKSAHGLQTVFIFYFFLFLPVFSAHPTCCFPARRIPHPDLSTVVSTSIWLRPCG